MGREIKRVRLNFAWPQCETWSGYLNPHYKGHCKNCAHCDGFGYSQKYKELEAKWYGNAPFNPEDRGSTPYPPDHSLVWAFAERNVVGSPWYYGHGEEAIMSEAKRLAALFNAQWSHHLNDDDVKVLLKEDRLRDFTHTFEEGKGWRLKSPRCRPTARAVNDWSLRGLRHDAINCCLVIRAECERLGYALTCEHCKGQGEIWDSKENRTRAKRWREKEPPRGAGYQLWETVTEGSPISPVFRTPEQLADWLVSSRDFEWNTDKITTREQWLKFINGPCWAPSLVSHGGKLITGVQAVE